jgi:hypothetical protein
MGSAEQQFQHANAAIERAAEDIVGIIDRLGRRKYGPAVAGSFVIEKLLRTVIANPAFLDAIEFVAEMGAIIGDDAPLKLQNDLLDYRDAR